MKMFPKLLKYDKLLKVIRLQILKMQVQDLLEVRNNN